MKIKKSYQQSITVVVQEPKNIELDKDTVKEITLDYIYKLRNWGAGHYIHNDRVHYTDTSHIHPIEATRHVTAEDYITEKIVQEIKES